MRIVYLAQDLRLKTPGCTQASYNVDGSGERRLAQDGTFPAWSPDGTQIAFIRNGPHWSSDASIWIMSADGSPERRLWCHSDEGGALSWSHSGKSLAFTYDSEIYTIQADGHRPRRVTLAGDNLDPAWQPSSSGDSATSDPPVDGSP